MAEQQNPQTNPGGPYSEMKLVIASAMNLWGVSHASVLDGTTIHMFLLFANAVIEDVNSHPYWENEEQLSYIQDVSEACPIPDLVMVYGILAHYAAQQRSDAIGLYKPQYDKMLNQILWNRLNGNTPIEIRPKDKSAGRSKINGRRIT